MSFFEKFLTKAKIFFYRSLKQTRFLETGSLIDQNCMLKKF